MTTRRPIFGGIAFALVLVGALVVAGATVYGYQQTANAFVQGPPWFLVTASVAAIPLGAVCLLALGCGIVGIARREAPGWPAVVGVVLAIPGFGDLAVAAFVAATVLTACAGPPGACA